MWYEGARMLWEHCYRVMAGLLPEYDDCHSGYQHWLTRMQGLGSESTGPG